MGEEKQNKKHRMTDNTQKCFIDLHTRCKENVQDLCYRSGLICFSAYRTNVQQAAEVWNTSV